jgi:hypothetical protein
MGVNQIIANNKFAERNLGTKSPHCHVSADKCDGDISAIRTRQLGEIAAHILSNVTK